MDCGVMPLQVASISALVASADKVDFETKDGYTALIKAAEIEQLDIIQALVENGETVDYETRDGRTALIQVPRLQPSSEEIHAPLNIINTGRFADGREATNPES
jgi:hypothetical protein